jgi:hypothetical protein
MDTPNPLTDDIRTSTDPCDETKRRQTNETTDEMDSASAEWKSASIRAVVMEVPT